MVSSQSLPRSIAYQRAKRVVSAAKGYPTGDFGSDCRISIDFQMILARDANLEPDIFRWDGSTGLGEAFLRSRPSRIGFLLGQAGSGVRTSLRGE